MLFGLAETKTRVDRAVWQRYYGFHVLFAMRVLRKAGQTVGQTDTAELVHLSYLFILGCMSLLTSCMMGGALPHNLPAYFCRVFTLSVAIARVF